METLKSMLEKLTKLSRECRYLEAKPGLDEGLKKVLWRHNGEMEMLHMFAHQLAREMIDDKTAIVRYEINGINYADVSFRYAVPVDYDEYEERPEDTIYGAFESR